MLAWEDLNGRQYELSSNALSICLSVFPLYIYFLSIDIYIYILDTVFSRILWLISGSPLLGRTGGVVELVLGSVFIIELDTGLAGIYFHRYYTEYDVCHKQNT